VHIALIALAVDTGPASAETPTLRDYRAINWTTAEGLPQNTINDIAVLPNGELWLATFGGLVRFDGVRFQVVDIARHSALASNRITALATAGPDAFWYVTQEGHLGRVEAGSVRALIGPVASMRDVVNLVATGPQVYVQTVDGHVWTSDGLRPWRLLRTSTREGLNGQNFVATTGDGQAWALFGRDIVPLHTEPPANPLVRMPLATGLAGSARGLWIGMQGSVARYQDNRLDVLTVRPALDAAITNILQVSDGQLWVAANRQVSRLTERPDRSWARDDLPLDLTRGVSIRALAQDGEGSLWIGTNGRGLVRVNRQPTQRFGQDDGVEAISALVHDGNGGAWASSSNCMGVFHLAQDGSVTAVHPTDPDRSAPPRGAPVAPWEPGGCGHALAPAPTGAVWIRWEGGLYRLDRAGRVTKAPLQVPTESGPIVARPDATLWVVSRGGDVRRVSVDRVLEQLTLQSPLTSAALAPDGTLWVGGTGEIFHVGARSAVTRVGAREGVPRGSVRDLLIDPDGTVWIATYGGGLGRWRAGRVLRVTVDEGLPDNSLSRVLDDGRGRLWLATNRGVAVLDRAEVDQLASGARRSLTPVVFGAERGMSEANFGLPAGFAAPDGALWFGTIEGAVRIEAARFPFNAEPPAIRVDSIQADERVLPMGQLIQIPGDTARVRLNFSATGLLYPERMRFRFRIDGIDKDWVDVGSQRTATFTPAAPGRHRFLLEARNEDGVWSRQPLVVDLEVMPSWWQRGTTRLAGIAGMTLLALAFYRYRVAVIEQHHGERVRRLEEHRRSEEQATALRSQLEHVSRVALAGELAASLAHEVNQPLTAIVANAEAGQHLLAAGTAHHAELGEVLHDIVAQGMRASEVISGLRDFLRTGHPDPRPVDLSELVRDMLPLVRREFEDSGVRLDLSLAPRLPLVEGRRVQLGQVVVNLLVNACEVLAQAGGTRIVSIETRAREDRVEIIVQDNGPGLAAEVRDRLFDPFVTTKPAGMGMGLAICRSIADAHRGRLTAESRPEGGLRMTLSLPALAASAVAASA
jgi:signal transduction histidine kinase/ligand-binding sensor domain-containing protein